MTPNTRLHAPHRTQHPRPPPPRPPPRLGGKETRRWNSPSAEERSETNTYGRLKSCTTLPGVSHFPGQPRPCEAGKWRLYPVRTVGYNPLADRPSPLPFSNLDEPMTVASALAAARPRAPPLTTHTPSCLNSFFYVGVGSGWAPEWEWWCDCSCGAGDGF